MEQKNSGDAEKPTKGTEMTSGIICQSCGVEAPTRGVEFHQNIGMLVMRRRKKIAGQLCKRCINKHFWKMTGTTLFLGPWGTISLVIAPCFIINNVVQARPAPTARPVVPIEEPTTLDEVPEPVLQPPAIGIQTTEK